MKNVKTLFSFLAVALTFTACDSDDSEYAASWKYECYNNLNYVLNVGSGQGTVYSGASYSIEFFSDGKATVVAKNVQFAPGMPAIEMTLNDLTWTQTSNSFMTIKATDVIPVVYGEEMPEYMINQLTVGVLDRSVQDDATVFNISYSVLGGSFKVVTLPTQVKYYGTTQVINGIMDYGTTNAGNASAGDNFTTVDPYYVLSFSDNMTANVDIYGAKFAQNMPAQNMSFKDIPVTVKSNGNVLLSIDELVPEIGGVPYPNYMITDFSANVDFASGASVGFVCMEEFGVSAELGYSKPSNN